MSKIRLITENMINELIKGMESANTICILTSFVMKSGVKLLQPYLQKAAERGAEIKICTGDYLFITQPEALGDLIQINEKIEIRLWKSAGRSFHPKAYLFDDANEGLLIVGSSNLSGSALTNGFEWNLAMEESAHPDTFQNAIDQFLQSFYHEQTIPLNEETVKQYEKDYEEYRQQYPNLIKNWTEQEEIELTLPENKEKKWVEIVKEETLNYETLTPRPSQADALEALQTTREEGYEKAMVVMATGLGKTYLAAFFAREFKNVLFVAHREEILIQARNSFQKVMPDRTAGLYFSKEKERDVSMLFASIFTLGLKQHLYSFRKNSFDLIIVDEFHHAAAKSYQGLLDYFQPTFLLGLTATPDRMDGKDVFALCDGNVAFQMHFIEAIQQQHLVPFHYYGVYDDTDYSAIRWLGTKYDEQELLAVQLREEMAQKVLAAWNKYKQLRTLAFCSSIKQANFLSNFFKKQGYNTVALHSLVDISRIEAIKQLENGDLDIIFTVDLFNEGVDIPAVDTLLFVRPTESLTIFTQQIGRGLRLNEGKEFCTIIDLIGNYRNADVKLQLFQTEVQETSKKTQSIIPIVPEFCSINLDINVINLLEEMKKKKQPRKYQLLNAYMELKKEIGRRPTYLELHLHGNVDSRGYKQEFKSYVGFLHWAEELSERESKVFHNYDNWLQEVERTGMSKSYKMIVLKYMLDKGLEKWMEPVTPEEVAPYFHRYLTEKEYRKRIDFSDKESQGMWEYNAKKVAKRIANMPMAKWSGSSKGLVSFQDNIFRFNFEIVEEDLEILHSWTKEICDYRLHYHFERKLEKEKK